MKHFEIASGHCYSQPSGLLRRYAPRNDKSERMFAMTTSPLSLSLLLPSRNDKSERMFAMTTRMGDEFSPHCGENYKSERIAFRIIRKKHV